MDTIILAILEHPVYNQFMVHPPTRPIGGPSILGVLILALLGLFRAHAQTESATTSAPVIVVAAMPTEGTFFSLSGYYPPSPFDPFPQLPLYALESTNGIYYYDDTGDDASTLQGGGAVHPEISGPPSPTNGPGTDGFQAPPYIPPLSYTLTTNCEDWTNHRLVISNTGTAAQVSIESTLPGTYYHVLTNNELNGTNWGIY
jgi:hypothetical protein